jgi:hypothetical protein
MHCNNVVIDWMIIVFYRFAHKATFQNPACHSAFVFLLVVSFTAPILGTIFVCFGFLINVVFVY